MLVCVVVEVDVLDVVPVDVVPVLLVSVPEVVVDDVPVEVVDPVPVVDVSVEDCVWFLHGLALPLLPGGPVWMWFLSPHPQPGRVPWVEVSVVVAEVEVPVVEVPVVVD